MREEKRQRSCYDCTNFKDCKTKIDETKLQLCFSFRNRNNVRQFNKDKEYDDNYRRNNRW